MKLSDWQEGTTFPQEAGLYQRKFHHENYNSAVIYSWFDGLTWRYGDLCKHKALDYKYDNNSGCEQTKLVWRGIIEDK